MTSLGKAVSILAAYDRKQTDLYDDLRAFYAPSECYPDERSQARSFRPVRRRACRAAGVKNLRQLRKKLKRAVPTWDRYNHFRLGISCV